MKGKPLVFTKKQERDIKKLYQSGLTISQVADKFNVSYTGMLNTLRKLNVTRRPAARKYIVNEHIFDVIDTEAKAYWLGFLYADGCLARTNITLTLSIKDKDQVERFRDFMESDTPITLKDYTDRYKRLHPRATVTVSGIHLSERLKQLGVIVWRTVPIQEIWRQIPPELLHHWVRGFFDGDGCAEKKPHIHFSLTREVGESLIELFAKEAGTNSDLKLVRNTRSNVVCNLKYKGYNNTMKIINYMYKEAKTWMPRKKTRIDNWPPLDYSDRTRRGYITRRKTPNFRKNQYAQWKEGEFDSPSF